jgi:hypothetical protein
LLSCTFGWSNGSMPQPAGHGGGVLPGQELRAERAAHGARGPSGASPSATTSGVAGRLGARGVRRLDDHGQQPLPCLPVDSATSCSAQSPKPGSRRTA